MHLSCSIFSFLGILAIQASGLAETHEAFRSVCSTGVDCDSKSKELSTSQKADCRVTVVFLICDQQETSRGDVNHNLTLQIRQLVVSLKSIALAERYGGNILGEKNRKQCVDIKIITNDNEIFENVNDVVQSWDGQFRNFLRLSYIPAIYPKGYEWLSRKYEACAATRLFLDEILPDTDSIIYADTDILFLRSVQRLWARFSKFDNETVAGMTPELYQRRRFRVYNPYSYNSGVILMNLTRMRAIEWTQRMGMTSALFLKRAKFGDQDMLIAYFKRFPQQRQNLPCRWNFKPRNCVFGQKCAKQGVYAVHGYNQSFFEGESGIEMFHQLFIAYEQMDLSQSVNISSFITNLKEKALGITADGPCDFNDDFGNLVIKSLTGLKKFENASVVAEPEALEDAHITPDLSPVPLPQNAEEGVTNTQIGQTECMSVCLIYCEPPISRTGSVPSKQFNETVVLLKSMVLMEKTVRSPKCINVIILGDDIQSFNSLVSRVRNAWDANHTKLLHFTFVPFSYSKDFAWMKSIFKPCSALRLGYADLLPRHDAVIHLDTDIIFARPPSELWAEFQNFSEETIMMMAPRLHSNRHIRRSRRYYWPTKFQGGVMLMNLTRMRTIGFPARTNMIATFYRQAITKSLPTQITLSIYFHHFPNQIRLLECGWSLLPYYCKTELQPRCPSLYAIHAVNSSFSITSFEPVYHKIFEQYLSIDMKHPFSNSVLEMLIYNLDVEFAGIGRTPHPRSPCSSQIFRRRFMNSLTNNMFIENEYSSPEE